MERVEMHELTLYRPNGFDRPPANADSYFRYEHFDAFALNARALNEAWKLHLPRELVGHDVNQEDWCVPLLSFLPLWHGSTWTCFTLFKRDQQGSHGCCSSSSSPLPSRTWNASADTQGPVY